MPLELNPEACAEQMQRARENPLEIEAFKRACWDAEKAVLKVVNDAVRGVVSGAQIEPDTNDTGGG